MKRFLRFGLSFALSLILIIVCFRGTDPAAVARSLSHAHPGYLALAVVVGLVSFAGRALRWRSLLSHLRKGVPLGSLFTCTVIGFMLSYVLPLRVGELARPILLARREKMSKASVIATVAVARMMDFLTVLLFFSIFLIGFSSRLPAAGSPWVVQVRSRGIQVGCVILAAVVALYVAVITRDKLFRFLEAKTHEGSVVRKVVDILHSMVRGFEVLKGGRALAVGMLYTLLSWSLIDLSILAGLKAFEIPMDFVDVFLLIAFLAVGIAVPTPAGLGGYQLLGMACLEEIYGLPKDLALAATWAQWCVAVIPVMVLGAILIWKEGLSVGQVGKLIQSEREATP
jgi:glycosyltransferase 2 family protein